MAYLALLPVLVTSSTAQPPGGGRRAPDRGPGRSAAQIAYPILDSAYASLRARDYDGAIGAFRRALDVTPARIDVRKNLAYALLRTGENDDARREFAEVVRRDSSDTWAALELAFLESESTEQADLRSAYRAFARLRSARDSTVRARARQAFATVDGSLDLRMRQWREALRQQPNDPDFALEYARVAEQRDQLSDAEAYYGKAAASRYAPVLLDVARVRQALGRAREAEVALRTAVASEDGFVAARARELLSQGSRSATVQRGGDTRLTTTNGATASRIVLGFSILGGASTAWSELFRSASIPQEHAAGREVLIARSGLAATDAIALDSAARDGAFVVIEGASGAAELFGFVADGAPVEVRHEIDVHDVRLPIVWEQAARIPRVRAPSGATVFSRDRWSGVPLVAGMRRGRGAVLWVAAEPGVHGFERFPYLLQALADLGMAAPLQARSVQAFFDYGYRGRADPAYLARRWRRMGVSTLHVAAWHHMEADPERDRFLRELLDATHRNGIRAFAWLELPHVSEQFWNEHPEWRERNALLQDAHVFWRKNINLANDSAFASVTRAMRTLLRRFDWDGATLSELYFEGPRGVENLAEFTPMNDDVRREVRQRFGFDPVDLFRPALATVTGRPEKLRQFLDYRSDLQHRLHVKLLDELREVRGERRDFGIAVCYLDDVFVPEMRDRIGADARRLLTLIDRYDFALIVQDPSAVWSLGPERYARIAQQYADLRAPGDRLSIDINIVARPIIAYPTLHQTGTEFVQLVHTVQRFFRTVTLYAEHSIRHPDVDLLPVAAANVSELRAVGDTVTLASPFGVGLRWNGPAAVNGSPWPHQDGETVWLPSGRYRITPAVSPPHARLLDFNGTLSSVALTPNGIALGYVAEARAIAVVDRTPLRVLIDGQPAAVRTLKDGRRTTLLLPGGTHRVEIITR